MATPGRRTDPSLETASLVSLLFGRGYEFEFFQAVRLLLLLFPERKQVGGTAHPRDEAARFSGLVSLAFPASAIDQIEGPDESSSQTRVTVTFMGLAGVQGVLPAHYTERIIARKAARDTAFAAFLDLFNHRLISQFYRAWQKHRPAVLLEAAALSPSREPDSVTQYLYDLIGMGTAGLRGRLRINDQSLLLYGGLIAQRPHSASALRCILRDYFGLPVQIEQFRGSWYPLDAADRSYLSPALERNQLGVGAFIGSNVWDQQSRFRVRLGPVGLSRFQEFLPGNGALERVVELTQFLTGQAVMFDVQVVLLAAEVPGCSLTNRGPNAPRLGWMGWLKTLPFKSDAEQPVFRSEARLTAAQVQ